MTSIDELFKGVGNKRKLEPLRDPNEVYKSARLPSNGHGNRHARIDDETDDIEAGPAVPPPDDDNNEDGDYGPAAPPDDPGDDEEGRFFGGGISAQETEVLDYVDTTTDAAASTAPEKIDAAWLRRTTTAFERRIARNAEQRAKHASDPRRFIASEAELDGAVRALSILSEHAELYPEFARLGGGARSLVGLLAHENSDIAIAAVEIVDELTDEDVAASDAQWGALVDAFLEADLLGLLVSNFERLDEAQQEADRDGVYRALGVLENLCGRAATAEVVGADEKLLRWLLRRIQAKEENANANAGPVSQNKQYAAEILAILVQNSAANRRRLAGLDAADAMLQLVAAYRRRDPERGGDEEEYMENLFEALTCLADEREGKAALVAAEGVELCLIMLKEGKLSREAALRLLDHAAAGPAGSGADDVCRKIVDAGGLKNIFTLFMKTTDSSHHHNHNHNHNKNRSVLEEHLLGIFASLLRHLPADSPERIRALAKFAEKNYEKTARLVTLRGRYAARIAAAALQEDEGDEDEEEERFSRRLDAGLFALRTLDVVLAWLAAEDAGARATARGLLAERGQSLAVVRESLRAQIEGIDDDGDGDEGARDTRAMLETLVEFLQ
ncbi:Catenin-beta-like protein [Whalleya microplaca]|nr:Catenin-beta-like protein [Whalleya microplaca]